MGWQKVMNFMDKYSTWLESDTFDALTKKELQAIKLDEKEIEDRFYKDLEFGTGGLRVVVGAGTNRINVYTVGKATQRLADYISKFVEEAFYILHLKMVFGSV
jgi:phosphoglucomutase